MSLFLWILGSLAVVTFILLISFKRKKPTPIQPTDTSDYVRYGESGCGDYSSFEDDFYSRMDGRVNQNGGMFRQLF